MSEQIPTSRIPIPSRKYDVFLSHAHEDKEFVGSIKRWAEKAGMKVFYDSENLIGEMNDRIEREVSNSRAGLVVWSNASAKRSSWVKGEYGLFEKEAESPDFQIVHLRRDDCKPPFRADRVRWIDCSSGFGPEQATLVLESLYSYEARPENFDMRAVYLARGGKPAEARKAKVVIDALARRGIRVVRDAPHNDFSRHRITGIMRSCRGFIGLIPERPGPATTAYILTEIAIAHSLHLPILLLIDEGLTNEVLGQTMNKAFTEKDLLLEEPRNSPLSQAADELQKDLRESRCASIAVVAMDANDMDNAVRFSEAVEHFTDTLVRPPERPASCFFGHVYRSDRDAIHALSKRCIESVAGMPCSAGNDFRQDESANPVQPNIVDTIAKATFAIFDISDDDVPEALVPFLSQGEPAAEFIRNRNWALNTCIEAGIAMGARIPVYFLARGPERPPVFMLKNQQIHWYRDDTELTGLLRKVCYAHRRITEAPL